MNLLKRKVNIKSKKSKNVFLNGLNMTTINVAVVVVVVVRVVQVVLVVVALENDNLAAHLRAKKT